MIGLSHGNMEVELLPGCGSIAGFRIAHGGRFHDLLRPATAQAIAACEPLGMGCFPLVPFSGPVSGGGFSFAGRHYPLPNTHPAEPFPIHGDGWVHPWQVEQSAQERAVLVYEHAGREGFPFAYRARQDFRLDRDGLLAAISVTNLSRNEMPAGVGLHPYFPKTPGCVLTTGNPLIWPDFREPGNGDPGPTPAEWDFSGGRSAEGLVLDHCFAQWGGRAAIRWPESGIGLELSAEPPLDTAVIFIPAGQDYFCVEPVSNADDGFNRMGRGAPMHGVQVLKPGGMLEGRVRFRPIPPP